MKGRRKFRRTHKASAYLWELWIKHGRSGVTVMAKWSLCAPPPSIMGSGPPGKVEAFRQSSLAEPCCGTLAAASTDHGPHS